MYTSPSVIIRYKTDFGETPSNTVIHTTDELTSENLPTLSDDVYNFLGWVHINDSGHESSLSERMIVSTDWLIPTGVKNEYYVIFTAKWKLGKRTETITDKNTTYELVKNGNVIALEGSDGSHSEATDDAPTKTSELENDSGYLTAETDPIFKASPASDIKSGDIEKWNNKAEKSDIPTKVSQLANDASYVKQADVASTYETKTDASGKLSEAKGYTDTKIANLINGAPTTLDTLKEIADAMEESAEVVEALDKAIGTKANASDLTAHTGNKSNPHGVTKAQVGLGNVDNTADADKSVKHATSADTATKATQDGNGNNIVDTYATKGAIPTKTSQLTNDSGFKTTDNNTTYELVKNGNIIALEGSDGSYSEVEDDNTKYSLASFSITATAKELNHVSGVTSNIQTQLNNKSNTSHAHDKNTISSVYETRVNWGGEPMSGVVSPIGAAISSEHSANRIAFLNPNAITIEQSDNGGSTWTNPNFSDASKVKLVTTSDGFGVGSTTPVTTNHRTRITLTAQDGTNGYVYTSPKKLLINVSSAGHGMTVTIESKTGVSGAAWGHVGTYTVSGWSGWNEIPLVLGTFGGAASQTSNCWQIRLTFANTSVNSSYSTSRSSILGLRLFGDNCWKRTSNMGETGHLYSYDYEQNATFPGSIYSPKAVYGNPFYGELKGNADTATKATSADTLTVNNTFNPNDAHVDALKLKVYDSYNIEGTPSTYGNVLEINGVAGHWKPQLWFDAYSNGFIRYRNRGYNETTMGSWRTIIDSSNIASQSVASATKATQDGSGNNIVNTYATKTALSGVSNSVSDLQNQIDDIQQNKTTYELVKNGSVIALEGSDGTYSEVEDDNTKYSLASFSITATAKELNHVSGVTSNIQTQLNGKAASSHSHTKSQITDFPTSMPASDVYSWAKASTKPSYSWSEITSKPSTFTPASHTHISLQGNTDNRNVATTPNSYNGIFCVAGLKGNAAIGYPSNDTYSGVVGFRQWADSSGGDAHELAFNNSGLFMRSGATTSWGAWEQFITSANIGSFVSSGGGTVVDITSSVSVSGSYGDNPIKKAVDTGSSVLILFNGEQEFADINITFPFYLQSKLCVSAFLYGENGTVDLAATEGLFDVQLDAFWSSYCGYGSSLEIKYV